jgi:hypothetical protein
VLLCSSWHVFGHNGYFHNPRGLITASLTRRRACLSRQGKSINRLSAVEAIPSAHLCTLKAGFAAYDANHRIYSPDIYEGKTDAAHINH